MIFIASTIFVLGVLIFVHELGHFLAAKAVGIGVPRFSIGFGPPTPLRFRRGETEYRISWLPLGGYVKMASREEQEMMAGLEGGALAETYPPDKLFENKPLWARILTISAGVIMNVIFAWAVYAGLALAYGETEDPTTALAGVVAEVLPAEAAALGALPSGTEIVRVNGVEVDSWGDIMGGVLDPRAERLRFEFAGDLEPVEVDVPGTDGETRTAIADALQPMWPARVGEVVDGSPAAAAGLRREDRIVAVDGAPVASWFDLVALIEPAAGKSLSFSVERGGESIEVAVVPEETVVERPGGEERKVGRIGIGPLLDERWVHFGVVGAARLGVARTWQSASFVLFALKGIVTFKISPRELGGPIAIGQISGEMARRGIRELLVWMALLSVNLAILNLLPIPVLDGGHLVFLILEGLRGGRPLSLEKRQRLTMAGLYVLLMIMVWALGNDFLRLLGW
ncbi:MAG: RIP metalloprotease RseP [Thermoanaerobaculia bacterium]